MKNFALSKTETETRDNLVTKLNEAWGKVEDAVTAFNDGVVDMRAVVERAVEDYNEVVSEAEAFAADIANEIETEYDNKSEKWQEGERAEAVTGMKDEWQGLDMSQIDPTYPDDLEIGDPGQAEALEALPTEPSE